MGITSIIHGKATHEETSATASRALGEKGRGKYLVVYDLEDAAAVCDYILGKGSREAFMKRFEGCCSPDLTRTAIWRKWASPTRRPCSRRKPRRSRK